MVAYAGWSYDGFVVQDTVENTIEKHLFEALLKTMLIESRETSNYHRCGRTDKGVSAFRQVISIDLRSNQTSGLGIYIPDGHTVADQEFPIEEYNYANLLNRVLPQTIQILAWAPVPNEFSSRFDCKRRVYRYYFPSSNLNIEAMRQACNYLVGQHDFRNFCKVDMYNNKVSHCVRDLYAATITTPQNESRSRYDLCYLTIEASSFIWHQIRCIMTVLLLVGENKEKPDIIRDLLNIKTQSSKPHYPLAMDAPLVLHDCQFDDLDWKYDSYSVKRAMEKFCFKFLTIRKYSTAFHLFTVDEHHEALIPGNKSKNHIPLLKRHTGDSVEQKLKKSAKKAKLKL
uniref:tRNA pseudouridine synthase n=1 Tax=Romanomermis culicivorax TaxID=13658 RepID=A0A915JKW8_ROMCU